MPNSGIIKPSKAMLGIVCNTPAIPKTVPDNSRLRAIRIPSGRPTKAASNNAIAAKQESSVIRKFYLLLFVVFASPVISFGQANAVDAAVNGYVSDSGKHPIMGAHTTLTNIATGISQDAITDSNGYYRFPLVPVGTYRLVTAADGFQKNWG